MPEPVIPILSYARAGNTYFELLETYTSTLKYSLIHLHCVNYDHIFHDVEVTCENLQFVSYVRVPTMYIGFFEICIVLHYVARMVLSKSSKCAGNITDSTLLFAEQSQKF